MTSDEIVAWRTICPDCGATGLFENSRKLAEELVETHNEKRECENATVEPVTREDMQTRQEALADA